jgi:hypothetical protein
MALFDDDTTFECIICDKELDSLDEAKEHALDEHAADIVEEEWGNYFNQEDG